MIPLLKVVATSKLTEPSEYYISKAQYEAGTELLTVYNAVGNAYGLLLKRENIISVGQ